MAHILLVDDDPRILKLYQDRLKQLGLRVETAADGIAAIQSLRTTKPDLVVLDLMMPRFTGVDVLKFLRAEANLKDLPVIVLSNSYMNQLAGEAASLGIQKALLKIRCSPSVLRGVIEDVLAGKTSSEDTEFLLAVPQPSSPPPLAAAPAPPSAPYAGEAKSAAAFKAKARQTFLQSARGTCAEMRRLCQTFLKATKADRDRRLQDLYRKIHFVAAASGLAECHHLAQMASAFEAMLFELIARPAAIGASQMRTVAATADFIALLFDYARDADFDLPLTAHALAVDDDPLSNRLVVAALERAHIHTRTTQDPAAGLAALEQNQFDLVLLDIELPGINGFELCRRLRQLPNYTSVPVIFVTGYGDFKNRAKSALSGGDDLIAKPIFGMELAVKAVSLLLKRQISPP